MEIGSEILLNYLGLEWNGLNDIIEDNLFITKFGSGALKNRNGNSDKDLSNMNEVDYKLKDEEAILPHHFDIKYDILNRSYFIKNFNHSGLFLKINNKQVSVKFILFSY